MKYVCRPRRRPEQQGPHSDISEQSDSESENGYRGTQQIECTKYGISYIKVKRMKKHIKASKTHKTITTLNVEASGIKWMFTIYAKNRLCGTYHTLLSGNN